MDLVRLSIEKPVTVVVGVIFVVLFGLISLGRLPYQLSPSVEEPDITVSTTWRGATPYEVEREIIERQENALKGIPGLVEMDSDAFNGRGVVTLTFKIGTDQDDALLRVSNKLNEVRSYPDDMDRPVISATGSSASPVIWLMLKTMKGNDTPVENYHSYFEDEVRQHLERVEGVADLFVGGGRKKEMHVTVSPERLAAYGVTVNELVAALQAENVNISAGNLGLGRRDYRIRTTAEFSSPDDIRRVVIRSTGQRKVLLGDLAQVEPAYEKRNTTVIHNRTPAMVVGIRPEPGSNVLELTDRVEEAVKRLNETKLKPKGITIDWVYDQRPYINGAISLIKNDIVVGGLLATAVLFIFLRNIRSTMVAAATIPISMIGTFVFLDLLGRNLNVISLAGLSFSIGLLIDNAIVVIENIERHRDMGKSGSAAAYEGAREVWGAILASTLTNVAVFLPVVFVREEAGQLFRDIAIAATAAVSLSLFVSISVIPVFANKIYGASSRGRGRGGPEAAGRLSRFGGRVTDIIMRIVGFSVKSWTNRISTISILTVLSIVTVVALMPKMEYLPQGNRNFVVSLLVPPPGLSYEERKEIGESLFAMADPYIGKEFHEGIPGIKNMFYVGRENFMLFGVMSSQEQRAAELIPLTRRMIQSLPGVGGVSQQAGIFQTRLGRGRTISVDLSGGDIDDVLRASGAMLVKIGEAVPGSQVRPVPSIETLYPEVRIAPDRDRLRANGMSASDLGVALDVFLDGRAIADYKEEGSKKVDLVLKGPDADIDTPEALYRSLIVTPGGKAVPVSSLAGIERTQGVTQIRHLERQRTVTLQVTPPVEVPLQGAMETLEARVFAPMREDGTLEGVEVGMSGAADKLTEARNALQWNLLLASLICFLLMASLYENFLYPFIIMLTVPLAGAGGFVGLKLLNLAGVNQPLDVLTMLGFVILIGVVVNNAILIVHQALNNVRLYGMGHEEAVIESTRTRIRPIYMTAITSIFGMLPLVVWPGAGSELYRGLGAVMLGGLAVSTVFTIFMIPPLLMFVIGIEGQRK